MRALGVVLRAIARGIAVVGAVSSAATPERANAPLLPPERPEDFRPERPEDFRP